MGKYKRLLEPGKIGSMEVKNRMVMAPMITHMANLQGEVTETMINYFVRRAQGGVGYITTGVTVGATAVDRVRLLMTVLRADNDSFIPGLSNLAEAIHDVGAKAVVQLSAGAGAQGGTGISGPTSYLPTGESYQNVSSSDRMSKVTMRQPRPLTVEEIEQLVDLYGQSALRIKQAGFDGVEMHAHSGYLIAQFLSPYFNKRTDKYGGDKENRYRFLRELIQSVKKYAGDTFPLIVRYSIDEFVEGGIKIEDSKEIAKLCQEDGVHAIHVSAGVYETINLALPTMYSPAGSFADLAKEIKSAVDIPVIVAGRINDPEVGERILEEGKADFVSLGRVLIADPDWPKKVKAGDREGIRRCIACNDGCIGNIFKGKQIRCTMNATAGSEGKYERIVPASVKKKVMVVGAGPAGMEAARVSALRGHTVSLYEKTGRLGGQINLAIVPPHKGEIKNITDYFSVQLSRLKNVEIKFGVEVTPDLVKKEKPDVVIIATGSVPFVPQIKFPKGYSIITAHDILSGKVKIGKEAVIVGGGMVGCETADYLADLCSKVTIVEMLDQIAYDVEGITRMCLLGELSKKRVSILTGRKVCEVQGGGCTVMDKNWGTSFLNADTVVFATGSVSVNGLKNEICEIVPEVFVIGDAKEPRRIIEANREGYLVAYSI